jgi:hypothetical protein
MHLDRIGYGADFLCLVCEGGAAQPPDFQPKPLPQ